MECKKIGKNVSTKTGKREYQYDETGKELKSCSTKLQKYVR